MIDLRTIALGALLAISPSSPLLAQSEAALAPRIEKGGALYDIQLVASGYGSFGSTEPRPIRQVKPLVPVEEWFRPDTALIKAHRQNPLALGYSRIMLTIDKNGEVRACEPTQAFKVPITKDAFCKDISNQRFQPALSSDGERIAGNYTLTLRPSRRDVDANAPRKGLIDDRPAAPAMMHVPTPRLVPNQFPPPRWWTRKFYRAPASWSTTPQKGWQNTPMSSSAIGLIVTNQNGPRRCEIVRRSTDAARNQAACAFAQDVLNPVWAYEDNANRVAVPLWIEGEVGAMQAIAPLDEPRRRAKVTDESAKALATALMNAGVYPSGQDNSDLRLVVVSDADSGTSECRILESSGSDRGDFDACRLALSTLQILPWQDMFGKGQPRNSGYWSAKQAE